MTLREAQRNIRREKAAQRRAELLAETTREFLDNKVYPVIEKHNICFIQPNPFRWDEAKAELEAKGFEITFMGNGNWEFCIK
jgi:hypothetical protein